MHSYKDLSIFRTFIKSSGYHKSTTLVLNLAFTTMESSASLSAEQVSQQPPSPPRPLSLISLPEELLEIIVKYLLEHDRATHERQLRETEWDDSKFPTNDNFEYHEDLRNLCMVARRFYWLIVPEIFKSVKLRNDCKSGASVDALVKGGHADLVKELCFVGTVPGFSVEFDSSQMLRLASYN